MAHGLVQQHAGPARTQHHGHAAGRRRHRLEIDERLARFVGYYPKARAQLNMNVAVVDLRYPSGFALRPIQVEPSGKQESKKGK